MAGLAAGWGLNLRIKQRSQHSVALRRNSIFTLRVLIGRFFLPFPAWAVLCGLAWASQASAKDRPWLSVSAPEFILYSDLSEKEAKAYAEEFAQYLAALRRYIPVNHRLLPPLSIVIFASERDFDRYRPRDASGKRLEVAGFFSRRESWASIGLGGAQMDEQVRRVVFHEGVHWFLSALEQTRPVWLEEGLAEVFSTFQLHKKKSEWGHPIPHHVLLLGQTGLLPIEKLLFYPRELLFHGDSLHTGILYAQSWALIHFLTFGDNGLPPGAFTHYLKLSRTGIHPDKAFAQAFGGDYQSVDQKFSGYLKSGRYFKVGHAAPPGAEFSVGQVAVLERELALGKLALAGGLIALATEHAQKAVAAGPEDARGYGLLGQVKDEAGQSAAAQESYTAAAARNSTDGHVYFRLGKFLGEQAAGKLTAPVARRVADLLEKSLNLKPYNRPAFHELAKTLAAVPAFADSDREFLEAGRKIFPADGTIKVGLAVGLQKAGDAEGGQRLLDEVLDEKNEVGGDARLWARRVNESWARQDYLAQITELVQQKKYAEAGQVIDEALAQPQTTAMRQMLSQRRQSVRESLKMDEAKQAWTRRDWVTARRLLTEIVEESSAQIGMKVFAQKQLRQLDQRKLGLPKEPPEKGDAKQ